MQAHHEITHSYDSESSDVSPSPVLYLASRPPCCALAHCADLSQGTWLFYILHCSLLSQFWVLCCMRSPSGEICCCVAACNMCLPAVRLLSLRLLTSLSDSKCTSLKLMLDDQGLFQPLHLSIFLCSQCYVHVCAEACAHMRVQYTYMDVPERQGSDPPEGLGTPTGAPLGDTGAERGRQPFYSPPTENPLFGTETGQLCLIFLTDVRARDRTRLLRRGVCVISRYCRFVFASSASITCVHASPLTPASFGCAAPDRSFHAAKPSALHAPFRHWKKSVVAPNLSAAALVSRENVLG